MLVLSATAILGNAQNVGIGTNAPQDKLHVTGGNIFINSASGGLKLGYPGTSGANFWEYITINGGADIRMKSTSSAGAVRYPYWFGQQGFLGLNLDTLGDPEPKYALHVAARNKYAIYGIANQYGSDTVAGVVGYANSPTPVPFSAGVRGESNSTNFNGIGVIGIQRGGGWGVAGFAKELGSAGYGAGVYAGIGRTISGGTGTGGFGILAENYNASGIAGAFRNYGGTTGKALQTSGGVQLTGIGEGADKVLTSDASGNATWQAAPLAFVHRATTANTSTHVTMLSYPSPLQTDVVVVTHNYNPSGGGSVAYNSHPFGVYWVSGTWAIYNEDIAAIVGTAWNVIVIRQ